MDFSSFAKQIVNMATGKGPQDAVADNSNRMLAAKEVSDFGYIIRARFDGLIRYYLVTHEAAANFPKGWETGDPSAIMPPRSYPDDLKCIYLRKPGITEFFDQSKPAHLRPSAEYPVAVEPMGQDLKGIQDVTGTASADYETFVKLNKIATPRFGKRLCDDRISIVSHPRINNQRPMVMKIVEFPDQWRFPQDPGASAVVINGLNADWDDDFSQETMRMEIRMHQHVVARLDGLAPQFLGLVTERGRGVIGYVSEFIQDAKNFKQLFEDAYAAGDTEYRPSDADREACLATLKRLHDAGIHHGDLHPGNVLRRTDGSVILIDFESTNHMDRDGLVFDSYRTAESEKQQMERWLGWTASEWHQRHKESGDDVD
ncbi:nuclear distribution protein pac-1a [Apiospora arundinis]